MNEKIEHMRQLVDELNKASSTYYNQGVEIMTNFLYDQKMLELEDLEKEMNFRFEDSPTYKVGNTISKVESLSKIRHEYPAKSLDKTKDIAILSQTFVEAGKAQNRPLDEVFATMMWKLDGSTIQLTYEDGILKSAATRGDGEVGLDITHNAKYIKGIPLVLTTRKSGKLIVRGEGTMSYKEFERINSMIDNEEDKYMNPRNLAAASIKLLDSTDLASREIIFHAFEMVHDSEGMPLTFSGRLDYLMNEGFNIVEYASVSVLELHDEILRWGMRVESYEIPVDGLVVALNNCTFTDNLVGTEHHPHVLKGYAFKWEDETAETTLREIEWSPSRTGLLNPVAIFDSVHLEGTTVSRASVHNFSVMRGLHLRVGDKISVYKANKIIPQIADNLSDNELPYSDSDVNNILGYCPECGKKGTIHTSKEGIESIYCDNPLCTAKIIYKFEHFCSRHAMNIEGISESTLTRFITAGYLKTLDDLYTLDRYRETIINTPGFGEKSWENIWNSIQKSRHTSFVHFITALGIPDVGTGQAKVLAKEFDYDINKFFYTPIIDLTHIKGIGEVLSDNIITWRKNNIINSKEGYEETEVERLLKYMIFESPQESSTDSSSKVLDGKTFVVTGKVEHFSNRDEIHKFIEDNGGNTSGSVTSKTSYLVNNDVTSTSGKNKKALELGIPILSEQELIDMINSK